MNASNTGNSSTSAPEFLVGGGEMGQRIRDYDWASTSLGPVENWPQSLRTCIRIMLTSRQPIWIGWGKELLKFYNDPYQAIVGGKHPWALGQPASVVWKDIWTDIGPMLNTVMHENEGIYAESQLLIMERNGYQEETYYTFSYTPIPGDDGRTEGMFCANTDDTDKIISERQLTTLTQLGKRLADCRANIEVIHKTIDTLQQNPHDFPFAIFCTVNGQNAIVNYHTPLDTDEKSLARDIDLSSGSGLGGAILQAIKTGVLQVIETRDAKLGKLPKGAWSQEPGSIAVLPVSQAGMPDAFGFLIVGLNPFRLLDDRHVDFLNLVSDQMATSFADVHVLEEERKRAEALAEIDRAKTTFFSNISHEFRTPLTLLMGPVEDALNDPATIEENKIRLDVAYRNALRMQKLVNTLLEFSRIEAGRSEGLFTQVDIAAFTEDLVSTFRSAVERAGMFLDFQSEKISGAVFVDTEMWEKIVLNLLSNAFKYTTAGRIDVRLKEKDAILYLSVSDTGSGIPVDQQDKIFDRFHRVENAAGRSQEGTGIGLAMVKELIKLHHGTIRVESDGRSGSTFIVSIPTGKTHLKEENISDITTHTAISKNADAYRVEALKWIPEGKKDDADGEDLQGGDDRPKVLLADDNTDMRNYVQRLLRDDFRVVTAVNGEQAYEMVLRERPALVLSDIMMPVLDGFGFLKKLRNHPEFRDLPFVFLSARAGEEAKLEGLQAGADDYLVKPFSARELLVRVHNHIRINQVRSDTQKQFYELFLQAPAIINVFKGPDYIYELYHPANKALFGAKDFTGMSLNDALPELAGQGIFELMDEAYYEAKTVYQNERPVKFRDGNGEMVERFFNIVYQPWYDAKGRVQGVLNFATDVTPQVEARKKIELSEANFKTLAESLPQLVWESDAAGRITYFNSGVADYAGVYQNSDGLFSWKGLLHEDDEADTREAWATAVTTGAVYQREHRLLMKDGSYRWHLSRGIPSRNEEGKIEKWFGTATDIHTAREYTALLANEVVKRTAELNDMNASLQRSNNDLQQFAHVVSHDLKEPLRKIKIFTSRLEDDDKTSLSDQSLTFLTKINTATSRLFAMIEGVLNYSTLNSEEQPTTTVDLNETIDQVVSDLEVLIGQKNARVEHDGMPSIEGASILLHQLFYNLINNSLKFSRPDIEPVVKLSSSFVKEGSKRLVRIEIADNGIGFEQEFANDIFNTFTRLNSKDVFEGTGLGLSLCKRIVERHGGEIHAEGAYGSGARFFVTLPVSQKGRGI